MKKQQKWIALFVTLTFMWLLQVSVMPLSAAGATEQNGMTNAEQGPDYYEAVAQKAGPAAKKSILPMVLIGVGVVAVAAVLYFVVLKTNYDITGTWTMNYLMPGLPLVTYPIILTGDKKSGNAVLNTTSGTYTVDGKKVTILTYQGSGKWEFIGEFKSKVRIEGDFKYYFHNVLQPEYNGTFYMDSN